MRDARAAGGPAFVHALRGARLRLDGKHVLVTGGTGSLGQAVVERLLAGALGRPRRVTVLSRDEAKQHDMRLRFSEAAPPGVRAAASARAGQTLHFRLGDVRDLETMVDA